MASRDVALATPFFNMNAHPSGKLIWERYADKDKVCIRQVSFASLIPCAMRRELERGEYNESRQKGEWAHGNHLSETADHLQANRARPKMPTEVGVLLIVAGIGGILLPGPVGTPFLILGGLMLWPQAFRGVGICVETMFPRMHHHGVKQINRFLDDLDNAVPWMTSFRATATRTRGRRGFLLQILVIHRREEVADLGAL